MLTRYKRRVQELEANLEVALAQLEAERREARRWETRYSELVRGLQKKRSGAGRMLKVRKSLCKE